MHDFDLHHINFADYVTAKYFNLATIDLLYHVYKAFIESAMVQYVLVLYTVYKAIKSL